VAVTSTNIAKILNIYPKKGALLPGRGCRYHGVGPEDLKTISAANHHSVLDYNVFEGFKVSAQARYTLSRGEVIWAWGQNSQPQPGRGRFVPRPPFLRPCGAVEVEGADRPAQGGARPAEYPRRGVSGTGRMRGGRARVRAPMRGRRRQCRQQG
jgi:hypothetical protein